MTAHHVLLALATYADGRTGLNARPSQATLAVDTRLSVDTVGKSLKRLETAGLIEQTGTHDTTAGPVKVWALQLQRTRADEGMSEVEAARQRKREQGAERARRFRQARKASAVTASECVTAQQDDTETDAGDARNGVGVRYVTQSEGVSNDAGVRYVTHSDRGRPSLHLPNTFPSDLPAPPSAPQGGNALHRPRGLGHADGATAPGPADGLDTEESGYRDWADERADADDSPAVVVESKEGRDGDGLATAPVASPPCAESDAADAEGPDTPADPSALVLEPLSVPQPRPSDSLEMARKRAVAEKTLKKARALPENGDPDQLRRVLAGMLMRAKGVDKTAHIVIEGRTLAEHLTELRDAVSARCAS